MTAPPLLATLSAGRNAYSDLLVTQHEWLVGMRIERRRQRGPQGRGSQSAEVGEIVFRVSVALARRVEEDEAHHCAEEADSDAFRAPRQREQRDEQADEEADNAIGRDVHLAILVQRRTCDDPEMRRDAAHEPGQGPLTVGRVASDALGMLSLGLGRIAGVAIVFFVLPATLTAVVEVYLDTEPAQATLELIFVVVTLAVSVVLSTLGPIAFAGILDEGVAQEYLRGHHQSMGSVLRRLPWRTLIAADIIVSFVVAFGLFFLIVPGLVLYGLLGMIGPIVVRERAGLDASLRRTINLSRTVPLLVTVLVVIPFALEQVIHESIMEGLLHDAHVSIQILGEWLLAIFLGGTLGLIEVALATELMVRNPLPQPAGAELLDDGQAPAV
jgi:hypothetical protein